MSYHREPNLTYLQSMIWYQQRTAQSSWKLGCTLLYIRFHAHVGLELGQDSIMTLQQFTQRVDAVFANHLGSGTCDKEMLNLRFLLSIYHHQGLSCINPQVHSQGVSNSVLKAASTSSISSACPNWVTGSYYVSPPGCPLLFHRWGGDTKMKAACPRFWWHRGQQTSIFMGITIMTSFLRRYRNTFLFHRQIRPRRSPWPRRPRAIWTRPVPPWPQRRHCRHHQPIWLSQTFDLPFQSQAKKTSFNH